MSVLLKLPLLAAVAWGVKVTLTSPQPPPSAKELYGQDDPLALLLPRTVKVIFMLNSSNVLTLVQALTYSGVAIEALIILATKYSNLPFRTTILSLTPSQTSASRIAVSWPFMAGVITTIIGALFRRSCYRALGRLFTFEVSIRKDHKLVTTGPYAIVRHPSYISAVLALDGALFCLTGPGSWIYECIGFPTSLFSNPVVVLCWIASGIVGTRVLYSRVVKEDRMLREKFGKEWDEWAARVPYRLIPGLL